MRLPSEPVPPEALNALLSKIESFCKQACDYARKSVGEHISKFSVGGYRLPSVDIMYFPIEGDLILSVNSQAVVGEGTWDKAYLSVIFRVKFSEYDSDIDKLFSDIKTKLGLFLAACKTTEQGFVRGDKCVDNGAEQWVRMKKHDRPDTDAEAERTQHSELMMVHLFYPSEILLRLPPILSSEESKRSKRSKKYRYLVKRGVAGDKYLKSEAFKEKDDSEKKNISLRIAQGLLLAVHEMHKKIFPHRGLKKTYIHGDLKFGNFILLGKSNVVLIDLTPFLEKDSLASERGPLTTYDYCTPILFFYFVLFLTDQEGKEYYASRLKFNIYKCLCSEEKGLSNFCDASISTIDILACLGITEDNVSANENYLARLMAAELDSFGRMIKERLADDFQQNIKSASYDESTDRYALWVMLSQLREKYFDDIEASHDGSSLLLIIDSVKSGKESLETIAKRLAPFLTIPIRPGHLPSDGHQRGGERKRDDNGDRVDPATIDCSSVMGFILLQVNKEIKKLQQCVNVWGVTKKVKLIRASLLQFDLNLRSQINVSNRLDDQNSTVDLCDLVTTAMNTSGLVACLNKARFFSASKRGDLMALAVTENLAANPASQRVN